MPESVKGNTIIASRGMYRLFLGVQLPQPYKKAITEWRKAAQPHMPADTRWVADENLHITVYFFGQIEALMLPNCLSLCDISLPNLLTADALRFSPVGITAMPEDDAPRMVWLRMARNRAFEQLSQRIHQRFLPLMPAHQVYKKPIPHITLGRFSPAEAFSTTSLPPISVSGFQAQQLVLFSSPSTESGASAYTPLRVFSL